MASGEEARLRRAKFMAKHSATIKVLSVIAALVVVYVFFM
jgi:hypothetical protein